MTAGQPLHTDSSQPPQRPRHVTTTTGPPAALDAGVVPSYPPPESDADESWVWSQIKAEARRDADAEPALASFLYATVLSHPSLAFHLANKLSSSTLLSTLLNDLFLASLASHSHHSNPILSAAVADLVAARSRDPACAGFAHCLLSYKGFLAVQAHRVAHVLWAREGRRALALALQSRVAEVFAVDIHPAAVLGRGVLLDHATGVVIGETAVVGDNVSILHHVTLGGDGEGGGGPAPQDRGWGAHRRRGNHSWQREDRGRGQGWSRVGGAHRRAAEVHRGGEPGEADRREEGRGRHAHARGVHGPHLLHTAVV
ncbi:hypothetical protein HU200_037159 [Digitaria exilis]|uniref:Serine acetyltransferase N-terminal domain-containing protein n=1 Tax=Digitaria exilis TaxID=1010633 RepID=A0A835BF31_9POAL|nr:hypothetical protein HU200_037159 [Digitaria exilis]